MAADFSGITAEVERIKAVRPAVVALINGIAGNMIPVIYVDELDKDILILKHEHDGRDLELDYAENCVKLLGNIWHGEIKLFTDLENESFEVS